MTKQFIRQAVVIPLLLSALACTSAPQKPESTWTVKATTQSQQRIWVTKPDGSRQCAPKSASITPSGAAQQLKAAGIMVFQFKPGNDGHMRIQKCGSPTGATVDLEISRFDLPTALSKGYVTKSNTSE